MVVRDRTQLALRLQPVRARRLGFLVNFHNVAGDVGWNTGSGVSALALTWGRRPHRHSRSSTRTITPPKTERQARTTPTTTVAVPPTLDVPVRPRQDRRLWMTHRCRRACRWIAVALANESSEAVPMSAARARGVDHAGQRGSGWNSTAIKTRLWPIPGKTQGLFVLSTGVMSKGRYNVVCRRGDFHW